MIRFKSWGKCMYLLLCWHLTGEGLVYIYIYRFGWRTFRLCKLTGSLCSARLKKKSLQPFVPAFIVSLACICLLVLLLIVLDELGPCCNDSQVSLLRKHRTNAQISSKRGMLKSAHYNKRWIFRSFCSVYRSESLSLVLNTFTCWLQ